MAGKAKGRGLDQGNEEQNTLTMRKLTPEEKMNLLLDARTISGALQDLMGGDEIRAYAYNVQELEHHLNMAQKHLKEIIKTNEQSTIDRESQ
jgi:hypothetical protein